MGDRSLRVAILGVAETGSEPRAAGVLEQRFDVEGVATAQLDTRWPDHPADCLVIDGAAFDDGGVDAVAAARDAAPDRSVFLLVETDFEAVVPAALTAGASETLPRALLETDPELLADRVASVVDADRSRSALPAVYDGVAGPISIHDADTGAMIHANEPLCELLGYSRGELRAKSIGDITPDIEGYGHERAMHLVQNVAAQGGPLETDWPLERADGTVRWVETRLRPAKIGGQEFVISAAAEVTERRRREHEYEEIFDAVNDVITVHDPWDEELLAVNETLCELTGYGRTTLLEMDVEGLSVDEEGFSAGDPYESQQRVAATGEPQTVDWVIETARGEHRRLEAVLSPATIAGEDRVLVLARDVTERRQLERTYREVFESVSDGLVIHDPETGEILDVNERYCELTGYPKDELVGANVRRIVPEDSGYSFETALERIEAAREEGPQLFEFEGERKDGGTFMGEIHLSTVEVRGEERVLASVRDITDRQRRERAIRELQSATERMQDATSAEAVAEVAVETAAEALGLPVTACWFHDADAERLRPVTATDPVYERNLHSPLSADRYEYEAFQHGAVDTYAPHDENPDNPLETAILLPLGDHGLIAAGRPDETDYDAVILDVARTLAEHTATALDRVDRAKAVRESERRFRLIADRIDQVIFLSAPDFSEAYYVNEAYEDLWGRPVDTLYDDPRSFMADIDPRDEAQIEGEFEAMLADIEAGETADSYEFEYRIEGSDGAVRWVRATGYPVLEAGAQPRFVGIVEDVTDRRELERTYRSVFENVSDGLVIHDPDTGEIRDVNDRFCAMNGYDRADLVGETIDVVTGPDHAYEEATERIARARAGEAQLFEWRNQHKDGSTYPVEIHLSVVSIRGAERVLASVRDITERKRREREYEQIFNSVQDGIALMDPETLEIRDANEAYLELVGYNDVETVRELGIDGLSASERGYSVEASREIHRRVADRGEAEVVEWEARTKDGQRRELEVKIAPAEIGGEAVHVAIHRDITERKRREREFEQLFNGVNDSITIHDTATAELIDVNETFCALLGDGREDILERGIEGYIPDDSGFGMEDTRSFVRQVVASEDPQQTEWAVETVAGKTRWLAVEGATAEIGGAERVVAISRDVTERRRRERMVRALHESTDDLQNAETPREVATAAIDAATEVLDLWLPTCWLHGADSGGDVLTPVAAGAAAGDLSPGEGPRELAPDDREYEVFRAGERAICSPDELDGGTPPGEAVLHPLGDHGLFAAVERSADGFDDVTLDAAGILARHVTSALDRVEQAQELRESERRFRLIAERIDEIVYLSTADYSEILYINPAYEEIYGRPIAELSEDPAAFVEAAHPDDRAAYEADVEELVADIEAGQPRDSYAGEYRIHRDGETRWVTVTRFPVENEDGAIDRIVGRVQDITERTRREREYEQIFDNVSDAIAVHDPATGELIDVNDTFVDQLGYDVETIRALGIDGLSLAEAGFSGDHGTAIIQRVAETGEAESVEWRVETADGEERVYEVNATAATIGGEKRVLAMNRDVTDERRTERRLRAILDRIDEAIYLSPAHDITQASQNPDYVSSGYADIWGQSLEAIRDRHEDGFFGTLHPDEEADYRAFVEGIVEDIDDGAGQDRYSTEYRIRTPDGEVRWVQSDYYPVEWESGAPRIVIVSREITARKERERRLVSFEAATDDLATADTPEEAARTAVDAATDTLQLSAVGVFLYDDADGVLRPEVGAPALPDAIGARPVGPDAGPLWRAFATGTVVTADGANTGDTQAADPAPIEGGTALTDWHGIPLGNHGLLFVGTREGSLGPDTLQSAHVLGATLEAALNHLHGQREVADREAELRTETERAERLDRIARLTQQVEAAITEASDPAEVERAVCERLVETTAYAVAWIGGVEVGTDRLTPRTVVGESRHYVEGMELVTTADAADPHPAVTAWQTDSVEVAASIVGAGAAGAWRQHVLSNGYQSVCAVPLTYDGITHGVLTVAADAPNAFGDRARRVLDQLGTSIGHALAGIERRRALESDETVELVFEGDGTALPFASLADAVGATVRHERTVRRADGDVSVYFAIEGDLPDDAVETAERTLPGTVDVVRDEAEALLVERVADSWFGSPLAEYGAVLREAEAAPDGTTISVELPARSDVRSFTERLQELAPSLGLEAKRQHQRRGRTTAELRNRIEERLTDRQHEALRTAYDQGYFEWPRESDGGEVADRLDITQPTFNKHLRLAERKTFGALFESEA